MRSYVYIKRCLMCTHILYLLHLLWIIIEQLSFSSNEENKEQQER